MTRSAISLLSLLTMAVTLHHVDADDTHEVNGPKCFQVMVESDGLDFPDEYRFEASDRLLLFTGEIRGGGMETPATSKRLVSEQRTREVIETVWVEQTRTRLEERTTYVPETRVKTATVTRYVYRWENGELVKVPVQEEISIEYTVLVPVTEQVEVTETVLVPELRTRTEIYTVEKPVYETKYIQTPEVEGHWKGLDLGTFSYWKISRFDIEGGFVSGSGVTEGDKLTGLVLYVGVPGIPDGVYTVTGTHCPE